MSNVFRVRLCAVENTAAKTARARPTTRMIDVRILTSSELPFGFLNAGQYNRFEPRRRRETDGLKSEERSNVLLPVPSVAWKSSQPVGPGRERNQDDCVISSTDKSKLERYSALNRLPTSFFGGRTATEQRTPVRERD